MTASLYHPTRLLVAVHRYDDADIAIRWGNVLAGALHLPVTLVHVVDESRLRGDLQEAQAVARDWLALLASDSHLHNVEVDSIVLSGVVENELSRLGQEHQGAIVLFAAFPGSGNGPAAMGGQIDSLIRAMQSPFIVVPAAAPLPDRVRRIVVGMDQSSLATTVLDTARRIARSLDVEVIAVEAVEPGTLPTDEFIQVEPVIRGDQVRIRGLASRVLLSTARTRDAAIIAVGSHGAGASRHILMGSTSEWLSQHSDRPLLIVPENRLSDTN